MGGKGVVPMKDNLLESKLFCNTSQPDIVFKSLEGLFFCSLFAQCEAVKNGLISRYLGDKDFLKEYCTIKLLTSRQSGHTDSIARLAVKHFDKVMFLTHSLCMSRVLKTRVENKLENTITYSDNLSCKTKSQTFYFQILNRAPDCFRGYDLEAIIVDGTFFLSQSKIDLLYKYPVINFPFFYIFVE